VNTDALFRKVDCLSIPDLKAVLVFYSDPWDNVLVTLDASKGPLQVDENKRVVGRPALYSALGPPALCTAGQRPHVRYP
jgi:hypothetical protein